MVMRMISSQLSWVDCQKVTSLNLVMHVVHIFTFYYFT